MIEFKFTTSSTVETIQQIGGDEMIVQAARVSTRHVSLVEHPPVEEQRGLINYLMEHRHGTPFEHGSITFNIRAPIFVWREFHRHRIGFSYNEESARYKTLEPEFYLPPRNRPMIKAPKWKAGRPKFITLDDAQADGVLTFNADYTYNQIIADMEDGYRDEYARYLRQLDRNLDPGLARDNLPFGIFSSCWVTCNPRSLMSFLSLRTHEPEAAKISYPLYEIEQVARKMEDIFAKYWPLTYSAFNLFKRVAP